VSCADDVGVGAVAFEAVVARELVADGWSASSRSVGSSSWVRLHLFLAADSGPAAYRTGVLCSRTWQWRRGRATAYRQTYTSCAVHTILEHAQSPSQWHNVRTLSGPISAEL